MKNAARLFEELRDVGLDVLMSGPMTREAARAKSVLPGDATAM